MNTRIATTVYYLAIGFLVICAGIIVFKLMFWPPCTPTGPKDTACVVDGWSVAGLAGTVLGVAGTVLALLGAFAVAAWWTGLDKRIREQVTSLYEEQKKEVNRQVDSLLADQQKKVNDDLNRFETSYHDLEKRIENITSSMDRVEQLTHSVFVHLLTDGEFNILNRLAPSKPYIVHSSSTTSIFLDEMRRLLGIGFIQRAPGRHFPEFEAKLRKGEVDVIDYFYITKEGKEFVELRHEVDSETSAQNDGS